MVQHPIDLFFCSDNQSPLRAIEYTFVGEAIQLREK